MNFKKIILLLIVLFTLAGCVNLKSLSYDDIINTLSNPCKDANIYEKGYQYYMPKGLSLVDKGSNYAIISSDQITYYLYVDLIGYINEKTISKTFSDNPLYNKNIDYDGKKGYVEIKLKENDKYLIEIMYNYAKIEVMVDDALINKALVNSISILNSMKYNDAVIENLYNNDKLTYTEEIFDYFNQEVEDNSDTEVDTNISSEVVDTDFFE